MSQESTGPDKTAPMGEQSPPAPETAVPPGEQAPPPAPPGKGTRLGALIVQRRMAAFVYGVGSTDWTVIAASALLLSAVALGMVYVAIRRVLVIRPMDLLRHGAGALA